MSQASCEDVRDALLRGRSAEEPELSAHARGCEQCTALLVDQALVGLALAAPEPLSSTDGMPWAELERAVGAESGPRAWLRSRATSTRVALGLAAIVGVVLLGIRRLRPDWSSLPLSALVIWVAAFVGVALGLILLALRDLGRSPAGAGRRRGWLVAAVGLPLAYALSAASMFGGAGDGPNPAWLGQALGCFVYGAALSSPLVLVLWLVDRGAGPRTRVLAAAGATGLAANAALLLHCPANDPGHLMLGHATIGAALALVGWLAASASAKAR
jgi:hypothetical protein